MTRKPRHGSGGELAALLSEDERSCLRTTLGDRYDAFRDAPLIEDGNGPASATDVADCLPPKSLAGFADAMFIVTDQNGAVAQGYTEVTHRAGGL